MGKNDYWPISALYVHDYSQIQYAKYLALGDRGFGRLFSCEGPVLCSVTVVVLGKMSAYGLIFFCPLLIKKKKTYKLGHCLVHSFKLFDEAGRIPANMQLSNK